MFQSICCIVPRAPCRPRDKDYGAAVSLDLTSRTLAVGSPLADYDKLGSDEPEVYHTRPSGAEARARGKVYVYYSEPAVQVRESPNGIGSPRSPRSPLQCSQFFTPGLSDGGDTWFRPGGPFFSSDVLRRRFLAFPPSIPSLARDPWSMVI